MIRITRIVVALDASEDSKAALTTAAEMAAELGAQIVGIFVEDVNLLRVAQLPFVRQVTFPAAQVEEIDVPSLERFWRAQARAAQDALSETASAQELSWRFEVRQGPVTMRLLEAAREADLMAIGRYGRALFASHQVGSTARAVSLHGEKPILLVRSGVDLGLPVLLIYGADAGSVPALELAVVLARQSGRLRVLLWSTDDEQAQGLKLEVSTALQKFDLEVSFLRALPGARERLAGLIGNPGKELAVISVTLPGLDNALFSSWLETLPISFLIVR